MQNYDSISLNYSYNKRNFRKKNCRENQNTHFTFNSFFSRKSSHLWENVEKYDGAIQATDDYITAHAFWVLDN